MSGLLTTFIEDITMINMERRKRVMQRSIRLGHCICDPKKPCPCDLFKEKDICLCAGERLESPTGPILLVERKRIPTEKVSGNAAGSCAAVGVRPLRAASNRALRGGRRPARLGKPAVAHLRVT